MNVTPYDFRKPVRLSAEWQQRLTTWFRGACALANRAWGKQLLTPLEVSTGELDTAYAQDIFPALAANVVGYRVLIAGGQLPTFLTLPRLAVLQLIAVMLGDDTAAVTDRELTLVEEGLVEYFLTGLWLPFFREAWPGPALVAWELQEREANPQGSRFFGPRDALLTLPWQIKGPWGVTEGQWYFSKKGILQTLADGASAGPPPLDERTAALRKQTLVSSLPVRMDFTLGTASLKLSELSALEVGDLLLLDQRKEEGVVAGAGSERLFRGHVGRVGSWKAFRIESFVEK